MLKRLVVPLCYLLLLVPMISRGAEIQTQPKMAQETPVVAQLLSEEKGIAPGRPFWVGVQLKMADGWDTYWKNPGDAGFPTKVDWHLPDGFKASNLVWPYPEKFVSQSMVGFGYTHSVLLLAQITPPQDLKVGQTVNLKADVSWLACKEQCVPGSASLALDLPSKTGEIQKNEETAASFAKVRALHPKLLSKEEGDLTVAAGEKSITVQYNPKEKLGEIDEVLFIPESQGIDNGAPQVLQKAGNGFSLNLKMAEAATSTDHVTGVLLVSEKGNTVKRAIQVDTTVLKDQPATVMSLNKLAIAIACAFVGGLILNVMPCVLPVIALKIFGFVKMGGENRTKILKHGGVFAFGVLLSFWILATLLLVLRASGHGIGWGFQLQEPLFVGVLTILLFLLGLSLFGLFEMGTSLIALGQKTSSGSPYLSSFFSGVLATLVATPCTGPLLGPALGFAMTVPPLLSLLIFTVMGIGMASPYLLFSAFPSLVRYLPKPGNWMITFKQIMGFLMFATCLWLLWVFGAQTSLIATFILLGALLVVAIGAWIYGTWATPIRKRGTRLIATLLAAMICISSSSVALISAKQSALTENATMNVSDQSENWQAFSPELVKNLRAKGTPVFIDFTAKWCLICQANKVTLRSDEMTRTFKERGVVTLTGDWTKRDPVITKALEDLGRSGVPVYVLYSGNPDDKPVILPQTLTSAIVLDALNKLPATKTTVYAD